MTERDLRALLRALGLTATADALDALIALATKKRFGPVELFQHVAALEEKERARRGPERRIKRSRLERFKPMADYDWNWPTKIDRPLVESVLRLDFLEEPRNVVLAAPQGLGKTMIAQTSPTAQPSLVTAFSSRPPPISCSIQESARGLERRLKHYTKIGLLVLDEIGFLAFDNRNADLFQVISRRYEKKSTVLTTNLAFSAWPTIFPNATCATALIDRVVHHADVIAIEGESYRAREAELQAKERRSVSVPPDYGFTQAPSRQMRSPLHWVSYWQPETLGGEDELIGGTAAEVGSFSADGSFSAATGVASAKTARLSPGTASWQLTCDVEFFPPP